MTSEIHRDAGAKKLPEVHVSEEYSWRWMWPVVILGLGLRLAQYATGRSLWLDEALLALNIIHRPIGGLFKTLDYHQGAPLGFLLLEKLATKLAGNGEFALRAFPFVFGILGLFFFSRVAKLYVAPKAMPVALSLFAFCASLIYYSSEAKQYSGDVAVTILALWLVARLAAAELSGKGLIRLSILGALCLWVSHPAAFVLSGAGLALLLFAVRAGDWRRFGRLVSVCGIWALSFSLNYAVSLKALGSDQALFDFWREYFPSQPLWSLRTIVFLFQRFFSVFDDPANLISVVGAVLFVIGCIELARKRTVHCWLLSGPLMVALLAGFLHKYPLGGRFFLFALAILFLVIGEGAASLADMSGRLSRAVQIGLFIVLLMKPISMDARALIHPRRPDDIKLAILYIQTHQQPADAWYVYHWARYQFWYYSDLYRINPRTVRLGVDCGADQACYAADLDQLRGQPRVWVLFSHMWVGDGYQEEDFFLDHLDHLGVRVATYKSTGARAYLYDLSRHDLSRPAGDELEK